MIDSSSTMREHERRFASCRISGFALGLFASTMPKSSVPFDTMWMMSCWSSVREVNVSRGKRSTSNAVSLHSGAGATVPTRSIWDCRALVSTASRMSCPSRSNCRAHSTAVRPASFNVTLRPTLSNSSKPKSSSNRRIERLNVGCGIRNTSAAADIVPSSAIATSWRNWSKSIKHLRCKL